MELCLFFHGQHLRVNTSIVFCFRLYLFQGRDFYEFAWVSSVLEENQNKQDISSYSNIKIIMEPNLKYMYLIDSDQTEY